MLPLLVGHVAQQMEITRTLTLVASYWGDERDAAYLGRALRHDLRRFFAAIDEHYSNSAHAVATVELSMRREPNVHVLVRGVDLKTSFVRSYWSDTMARDVSFEMVRSPMSIACYIFKLPLLGLVGPPAARYEILALARDLNGGSYGYEHGSFVDPELAHRLKDRRAGVLDYAARHRQEWTATKMPYDVSQALLRAVPLDDALVDDLFRGIPF